SFEQLNRLGEPPGSRVGGTQNGGGNRPQGGKVAATAQLDRAAGDGGRLIESAATQVDQARTAAGVHEPVCMVPRFGHRDRLVGLREGLLEVAQLGKAPAEEQTRVHELLGLTSL